MHIEYAMIGTKFTILYDDDKWISVEIPSTQPNKQVITNNGDILMTLPDNINMLVGESNDQAFVRIHVDQPNVSELTFIFNSAQSKNVFYSEQNTLVVDDMAFDFSDANVTVLGPDTLSVLLTNIDTEITIQKYMFTMSQGDMFQPLFVTTSTVDVGGVLPEITVEFDSSVQTYKELPCLSVGIHDIQITSDELYVADTKMNVRRTNSKGIMGPPESIDIVGNHVLYPVSLSDDINTFDGPALFDAYASVIVNDALPCKAKIDTSTDTDMTVTYDDPTLY